MRWKHIKLFQVKSTVPWSAAHKDTSLDLVYAINPCCVEANTLWFNSCQSAQYKFRNDQRTQASCTINDANSTRNEK